MKNEKPKPSVPYCWRCQRPMTLVRKLPRFGALPELNTYRCTVCGHVETMECEAVA